VSTERYEDPAWFDIDALFASQSERLFEAAYVAVGTRRDAEAITHDAFLKLWERHRNEPIDDPETDLFRTAMSGVRMRRSRAAIALRGAARSDAFVESEMPADVRRRLMDVTPRQRAALVLMDRLGHSEEEAGYILRTRTGTVEALVTEGRRTLRAEDDDAPGAREVLALATEKVHLDPYAAQRQHMLQRRAVGRRRLGGLATVGAVIVVAVAFVLTRPADTTSPARASSPTPSSFTPRGALLLPTIVRLDGRQKPVVGLPADAIMLELSPDGRRVAYVSLGTGPTSCANCRNRDELGTARADGIGTTHPIGSLPLRNATAMTLPAWSPDGRRLAFVMNGRIWLVDVAADRLHHARGLRQLTGGGGQSLPAWSPDGTAIAYVADGAARFHNAGLSQLPQIFSKVLDGSPPTQLTHDTVPDQAPAYSPDGSTIAYSHGGQLWIMNADGSNPHFLLSNAERPRWSPDGTKIAFLASNGARVDAPDPLFPRAVASQPLFSIDVLDVTTGRVVDLGVDTVSPYSTVSWTPDGQSLLVNVYVPPHEPATDT
jgi:DNA-directed RNA polymerase specialized sigma24 family protein